MTSFGILLNEVLFNNVLYLSKLHESLLPVGHNLTIIN